MKRKIVYPLAFISFGLSTLAVLSAGVDHVLMLRQRAKERASWKQQIKWVEGYHEGVLDGEGKEPPFFGVIRRATGGWDTDALDQWGPDQPNAADWLKGYSMGFRHGRKTVDGCWTFLPGGVGILCGGASSSTEGFAWPQVYADWPRHIKVYSGKHEVDLTEEMIRSLSIIQARIK